MFEPTIKYKRVNDPPKDISKEFDQLTINDKQECLSESKETLPKDIESKDTEKKPDVAAVVNNDNDNDDDTDDKTNSKKDATESYSFSFEEEEEEDSRIEVDPNDKERIIVTLSTGKQFSADRYCPHAGADLSFHGKVSEDDYPPEIGPVLMCPIHYWEFALEKGGKGGSGFNTINACPVEVAEKCAASADKKKLDW